MDINKIKSKYKRRDKKRKTKMKISGIKARELAKIIRDKYEENNI